MKTVEIVHFCHGCILRRQEQVFFQVNVYKLERMLCSFWGRSAVRVLGLALVLSVLIYSLLCLKHLRTIYDQHQKFKRLESYEKFVNEVTDYLDKVGETANRSDNNLSKLQSFLDIYKMKHKTLMKPNISSYSSSAKSSIQAGHR